MLAAVAVAAGLTACGNSQDKPKQPALSAAERKAADARRQRERPHYSAPEVAARVAALPATDRRHALITELRRSVRRDARARVARKELRGPVLDASCEVTRDDKDYARANPAAPLLRYDCLAINFRGKTEPPMLLGSQFEARVDFAHNRYAWCLFTPVGGEGTHSATTFHVEPSPACVAPVH